MLKSIIAGLVALLVLALTGVETSPTAATHATLVHDGLERTYTLAVPEDHDGATPAPLIVALHPFASSGLAMQAMSDLDTIAGDMFVVYPDAVGMYWDDGRSAAGLYAEDGAIDDVGFIAALIDHLAEGYAIDESRVYVVGGLDNGATMAYALACAIPERLAGVAAVGAWVWSYHTEDCDSQPVDLLVIGGTADPYYPISGREPVAGGDVRLLDVREMAGFWSQRAGCATTPTVSTNVLVYYGDCGSSSVDTAFALVNGGGHNWARSGDYALNRFGFDVGEVIVQFFNDDPAWVDTLDDLPVYEDDPRSFRYYVPSSYDADTPMPLVMVLHGRPGTGQGMAIITGMNSVAEQEGFIAVYPDGLNREWNYVHGVALNMMSSGVDDTAFLRTLLDDLALDLNIDRERVYVTGFSNGGFMTHHLSCDATDTFAAFAAVGATAFINQAEFCASHGAEPVPFLLIYGLEDVSVPPGGTPTIAGGEEIMITLSIGTTLDYWVAHNDCTPQAFADYAALPAGSEETRVRYHAHEDCAAGGQTTVYLIEGGGHNWPGRPGILSEEVAGNVNTDIFASQVIWEFFAAYTLDG